MRPLLEIEIAPVEMKPLQSTAGYGIGSCIYYIVSTNNGPCENNEERFHLQCSNEQDNQISLAIHHHRCIAYYKKKNCVKYPGENIRYIEAEPLRAHKAESNIIPYTDPHWEKTQNSARILISCRGFSAMLRDGTWKASSHRRKIPTSDRSLENERARLEFENPSSVEKTEEQNVNCQEEM